MAQTFKVYDQPLNMGLNMIKKTVLATIALHNFRRKTNTEEFFEGESTNTFDNLHNSQAMSQNQTDARSIRDYLKTYVSREF